MPVNWRSEEGKTLPASRSLRKQAETYDVAASLKRGCGAMLISEGYDGTEGEPPPPQAAEDAQGWRVDSAE